MYSTVQLEKTSFAVWRRTATELQKAAAGSWAKQRPFPEEREFEERGSVPTTHKRSSSNSSVWYHGERSKVNTS